MQGYKGAQHQKKKLDLNPYSCVNRVALQQLQDLSESQFHSLQNCKQ